MWEGKRSAGLGVQATLLLSVLSATTAGLGQNEGVARPLKAAPTHRMEPADLARLKTIERPRISPDGRMVAYTVRTPTAAGKPKDEHVWIANTDRPGTARPFLYGSSVDTMPDWSPDGGHLAFLSNRVNPLLTPGSPYSFSVAPGSERDDLPQPLRAARTVMPARAVSDPVTAVSAPVMSQAERQPPPATPEPAGADVTSAQLWWIPVHGGEAEPLTALGGNVRSFKWSHDGRHIAFLRTDGETAAERARKPVKDDRELVDRDFHFDRLWVYDLDRRQARLLTFDASNVDTLDWSPDDRSIVSRVSPTPRLDDYWRVSKVEIFDAATGALQQVVEAHSGYQEPLYSQDGTSLAYSRFTPTGITDVHLVRVLATGKEVRLEDTVKGTLAELQWIAGGRLLVNSYVGAHTEASLLQLAPSSAVPLASLPLTALGLDSTRDGTTITFLGQTPNQPEEVSIWHAGSTQVLTAMHPEVASWQLGSEQEVSWKSPKDGRVIFGVLSLPPGYQPGQHLPAVIHLHGGPEEAFTVGFNGNWYNYAALLASQGYVVLQPNYRGSAGQEIAFTEGDYRDWGGGDFDDVMAGVDWLEAHHYAEVGHLAIAGWSYGGFLTAWAITHTDRFQAAMAGAAITDVFSMALTTDIAPSYVSSYLGSEVGNSAEYDRHSPVRFTAACHTPVLVLHGQADHRVPLSQGQEFYNKLHFNGQAAEMVTYPREPHIFGEQEHQVDSLTRELAWFARYLKTSDTGRQQ